MRERVSERAVVLVVDDDPDLLEVTEALLDLRGFAVLRARNGAEALDILSSLSSKMPCVVLLDLMMPVMNGWDFLRRLRGNSSYDQLRVVVLSAVADDPPEGAVSALVKPVDAQKLLDTVEQYC